MQSAVVIKHSIGQDAPELVTVALTYPRFIHAEFMTHRRFSRNAASSRAIPFLRMLADIRANMALPAEWRMEESGMQGWTKAGDEQVRQGEAIVRDMFEHAAKGAADLADLGFHKQHVNRYLEPYQHIRTLVTTSLTQNFFGLRDHGDADPTIAALAVAWKDALANSKPQHLRDGEWHLPYIDGAVDYDRAADWFYAKHGRVISGPELLETLKKISAARCARVSYVGHDGKPTSIDADFKLFERLITADLIHASPTEHQAKPDFLLRKGEKPRWMNPERHGNLWGWQQHRKFIANEDLDFPIAA